MQSNDKLVRHNFMFIFLFSCLATGCSMIGAITLATNYFILLHIFNITIFITLLFVSKRILKIGDDSYPLIIIIALSAFQSLIVGYFVAEISTINVKILTGTTIILPIFYFFFISNENKFHFKNKVVYQIFITGIILSSYAFITFIIYRPPAISAISSLRNVISPFLFVLIGILSSKDCDQKQFLKIVLVIGFCVIFIGVLERFLYPDFWKIFHINELFEKKGIMEISRYTPLPANWYASESIAGIRHIRRMATSFADPVNAGTFMFLIFMISYLLKNRLLLILSFISILLIISKGGIVGILSFLSFYFYFKYKKLYPILLGLLFFVGVILFLYIKDNSSGSMIAHINGLYSGVKQLPYNLFGQGLGSTGVLQNLFRINKLETDIVESGLGVIIGQLGIIGLFCYFTLLKILYKSINQLNNEKIKVVCFSILTGILINILFNEVALSPNSCAGYFIFIGLVIGKNHHAKQL